MSYSKDILSLFSFLTSALFPSPSLLHPMASSSRETVSDFNRETEHLQLCRVQHRKARSLIADLWKTAADDIKFVRDLEINQTRIESLDLVVPDHHPPAEVATALPRHVGKESPRRHRRLRYSRSPSRSRTPGSGRAHPPPPSCGLFNYLPPQSFDSEQSRGASGVHFILWAQARLTDHGLFPLHETILHLVAAGFVNPCIFAQSDLRAALAFFNDYLSTDKPDAPSREACMSVARHLHFQARQYLATYWTAPSSHCVSDLGPAWVVLALNPEQASSHLASARPHIENLPDPKIEALAAAAPSATPAVKNDKDQVRREYVCFLYHPAAGATCRFGLDCPSQHLNTFQPKHRVRWNRAALASNAKNPDHLTVIPIVPVVPCPPR